MVTPNNPTLVSSFSPTTFSIQIFLLISWLWKATLILQCGQILGSLYGVATALQKIKLYDGYMDKIYMKPLAGWGLQYTKDRAADRSFEENPLLKEGPRSCLVGLACVTIRVLIGTHAEAWDERVVLI